MNAKIIFAAIAAFVLMSSTVATQASTGPALGLSPIATIGVSATTTLVAYDDEEDDSYDDEDYCDYYDDEDYCYDDSDDDYSDDDYSDDDYSDVSVEFDVVL
jgi:hypothetical protein